MLLKYFLFPLLWGSLGWLKFRLIIRFLSKVIAKNKNERFLSDGPFERIISLWMYLRVVKFRSLLAYGTSCMAHLVVLNPR